MEKQGSPRSTGAQGRRGNPDPRPFALCVLRDQCDTGLFRFPGAPWLVFVIEEGGTNCTA